MDASTLTSTIIGIAFSTTLFLLGYRRTIGARKERIRSGNDEIEKILVRRIVLENFMPNREEIYRLIDAKARDFGVRPSDLLSEDQLINTVYTRIVESDFIPLEQRKNVLGHLGSAIEDTKEEPVREESLDEALSSMGSRRRSSFMVGTIAVSATLVGTLFTALAAIYRVKVELSEVLFTLTLTATTSLAILVFIIAIFRTLERQKEEPSKTRDISDFVGFERSVIVALQQTGLTKFVHSDRKDSGYDFIIQPKGQKVLVEVKGWNRRIPISLVDRAVDRLRDAASQESASEAILVTRNKVLQTPTHREDDIVKIMTLREFRSYLTRSA